MNMDIVNFSKHGKTKELRWFIGEQLPQWIREMLRRKDAGEDAAKLIDELASVCCIEKGAT